jgi:peptidoglycan-associated lipoprotein
MQSLSTRLLVMLFVLTLLVAGCAKKPVEDEAAMGETTEVAVVEDQPAAVVEEEVDEAARAAAEAEAASLRAANDLVRIYFDFDQYVLTDSAKDQLAINAKLLKAAPAVKVKVEGHCDERGSDEYNLALGEKRALATKNYLVSLGVATSRLSVISYGEEMPLDSTTSEAAWAKNRRAEFKVQR